MATEVRTGWDREFEKLRKKNEELEIEKLHLQDQLQHAVEDLKEMAYALDIFETIRKEYVS